MSLEKALLLAQVAATLYMAGIIWFAQIAHYPLLEQVGRESFAEYQNANMRRTGWVVGPPMLTEGITAIALVWVRPSGVSDGLVWTGLGLLLVIWISTLTLQVPRHQALARGFDDAAHRALVATNWIRTVAWSLRGLLVLGMLRCAAWN
jgi:uncharacterized membrane protein